MRIKICGITNLEDALVCQKYGVDAIGYIFYPESKRFIEPQKAAEISRQLSPFITKVGVFVNESAQQVNEITALAGLNAVQLHGEEGPKIIHQINYHVIKGFRVKSDFDFKILNAYTNCSFLLDTFNDKEYGGTGHSFNWQLIPEALRSKVILAGGISLDNIEFIWNEIKPAAVDLSSALELAPGKKDHKKIIDFLKKIQMLRAKEDVKGIHQ